jgi:DNA-binding transcriptional ArsR family regulator
MRRNSRNHPFALPAQPGRGGMAAKSLTIGIVILERSRMGFSMDVPQRTYPQDGWGRRFMDKRLWYLIAGTRGGINRARILWTLHDRPYNANDLATRLALDYKTIRHHLDVLRENDCVMTLGSESYGTLYSLSPRLQVHFDDFLEIWRRIESQLGEK